MLQMPFFLIRKTVQKFHFEDVSDGQHEGWYGEPTHLVSTGGHSMLVTWPIEVMLPLY